MGRLWGMCIAVIASVTLTALAGCASQKNTARNRWWKAFNARYNTYFNGQQALIEGNLEKEKNHKDNYTDLLPLYPVGNKESRAIGKSHYDRAIEKAEKAIKRFSIKTKPEWRSSKPKTARDREWLGRREYNPFIWRAWMLLGKAQFQQGAFEEAAATFSYMSRLYQTQPLQYGLARAWLAKCYTELDWLYDAEDVIRNMNRDSADYRTVKDWDYTYANYYLRSGDYGQAVGYLKKVIRHERRSRQRARAWYLLGQIERSMGHREQAEHAFRKVMGCHPPYEMAFNARIAQTEVLAKGNTRSMIGRLRRMAANDNNKDYLDQVYYAIGNIWLVEKDTTRAIEAYEKGQQESVRNGIEKGVLLQKLGDLYWQQEKYSDAQRCYGQAIGLLDKERKDYNTLSERSKILDELVPYTDAVHLQDSLLTLASLPEGDLYKIIDRMISDQKKKEREERRNQEAAEAERQQQSAGNRQQAGRTPTPTPTVQQQTGNGEWYFYNPLAVSRGKATFQQQWGKRENADNWQRSNLTVVNLKEDTDATDDTEETLGKENTEEAGSAAATGGEGDANAAADSLSNDPHQREYYLAQIPFSEEQKAACHAIIQDGLLHAGIILKDRLDNLALSEKQLVRLTSAYPAYEHLDDAWYHLFLLYSRQGRRQQAEACVARLQADFPQSEWTTLLTDPYYAENARFGEHIEDSLYAATYQAFKDDRHDIIRANARLSAERFPLGEHRSKFIFIDGLSLLNDGNGDACLERMRTVVEQYPQSEVSQMAGMIIKGVQAGRQLYGGKFDINDVWSRRDILLTEDSTRTDTLSAERNQDFLFLLTYDRDSVNENHLLYEMARYNFTNFLVRNFEIVIDEDNGLRRMIFSGFLNYDEALQYARQLYADKAMAECIRGCRSLIIGSANLSLLGTQFSYDDYERFYEQTFQPMQVSEERLLIKPADIELTDPEDVGPEEQPDGDDSDDSGEKPAPAGPAKKKVEDFDFGDDFW